MVVLDGTVSVLWEPVTIGASGDVLVELNVFTSHRC